jgi:hypothetical protein
MKVSRDQLRSYLLLLWPVPLCYGLVLWQREARFMKPIREQKLQDKKAADE